jgi:hypothetical protein
MRAAGQGGGERLHVHEIAPIRICRYFALVGSVGVDLGRLVFGLLRLFAGEGGLLGEVLDGDIRAPFFLGQFETEATPHAPTGAGVIYGEPRYVEG